ncbi:sulfoxide reductase heme-binding subunit YedZ [Paracoccus suum]|uniref:Protein-methionine-sulfoxide reductase heme-binding subunit MsrQ n=1 Tax=Paracoccus suum TaxID=2259340 RepID=A0A344PHW7_9RHOB|nr:ferric reductase-like transmembrane domain-containing protein [Paracoccus suum]AXC48972.1 sulfoxide reductase heme-binding subunit YedZ [Paracoccus suum]
MTRWLNTQARRVPEWAVWLGGALPLGLLIFDTLRQRLGVDPVAAIEHRLGRTAIYFLIASLAVTPLLRLAKVNLVPLRRALGLLAFGYVVLHITAWVVIDMGLRWEQLLRDIVKRPYLLFGAGAALILLALALTSSAAAIRRMGGSAWKRLHRLVYVAAVLTSLHWLSVGKVWHPEAKFWGFVVLVLLGVRLLPRGFGSRRGGNKSVAIQ